MFDLTKRIDPTLFQKSKICLIDESQLTPTMSKSLYVSLFEKIKTIVDDHQAKYQK